ncbi:hypothetical protein SBA1_30061 [Candidatus Sulfotelmatobacter kueseliae]|uniref:Uncharacterized protein n=1 Tax=Candidatus Sulfotelmatobacter kueseliae TaxID=2042962 RepID=A0A2U3KKY2_9BACT|nr:hypothetical protein SBA1_30061 [Candidatus Sulfotelmatobacter kueseliae]
MKADAKSGSLFEEAGPTIACDLNHRQRKGPRLCYKLSPAPSNPYIVSCICGSTEADEVTQ